MCFVMRSRHTSHLGRPRSATLCVDGWCADGGEIQQSHATEHTRTACALGIAAHAPCKQSQFGGAALGLGRGRVEKNRMSEYRTPEVILVTPWMSSELWMMASPSSRSKRSTC